MAASLLPDADRDVSLLDTALLVWGTLRRHLWVVVLILAVSLALPALYIANAPAAYTATATMVIDTQKQQSLSQQNVLVDASIDSSAVQTEVEILKSDNVGAAVIRDLHLGDDREFTTPRKGIVATLAGPLTAWWSRPQVPGAKPARSSPLGTFKGLEKVARIGLTYAIAVSFTSDDSEKAARIANAIIEAYVNETLSVRFAATRRTATWLGERIEELRVQSNAADQAVVDFKKQHNINTIDAGGKLMDEQQLSEVNSQLTTAHAATAEAKAKFARISDVMKQPVPDASVSDALNSSVIVKLRGQYLELASKQAIWSAKYGVNHQATVALRIQMGELQRNIADEMTKIAQGYQSDYNIAVAREDALTQSLASSVAAANTTNQAQIQLRELVSQADTLRTLRENFSRQYMETTRQDNYPVSKARMISPADESVEQTAPKSRIILATGLIAGLIVSICAAFVLEAFDMGLRSKQDVVSQLKMACLAVLPLIPKSRGREDSQPSDLAKRTVSNTLSVWRHALNEPFSRYAEGLRALKVAIDLETDATAARVIGITSSLPAEGKSTVSVNLARLLAHSGCSVLLIDADLRNSALTRGLTARRSTGLVDAVEERHAFMDVVWTDPASGLFFLPVGGVEDIRHTSEFIGSSKLQDLIGFARGHFQYIVVDLPPLAPIVDARTATRFIDRYVFVAQWGTTKVGSIKSVMAAAPEVFSRTIGVVLNKADFGKVTQWDPYFTHKSYDAYYGSNTLGL